MKLKNFIILTAVIIAFSGCADQQQQEEPEPATTTESAPATGPTEEVETTETEEATETAPSGATEKAEETKTSKRHAPVVDPGNKPEPVPEHPANQSRLTIKYAVTTGVGIKFYDGQEWSFSQYEKRAARSSYMVRDEIHELNEFGESTGTVYAPVSGELIKKTSTGYLLCDSYTPQESYTLGAMPRAHSKIYEYRAGSWSELGHWYLNQWECASFHETESGELTVSDTLGRFYALKSSKSIHLSVDSGLLVYNFNAATKTTKFQGVGAATSERWLRNYINSDRQWQKAEGKYFSSLGYVYSPTDGLQEFGNAMEDFRSYPYPVNVKYGERPILVNAGFDAAARVIYWVECATGYLIEYRLATNQIVASKLLYNGDGTTIEGQRIAKKLNPILSQGKLYFGYSGQIMALDLELSSVSVVLAEPGRLFLF